MRNLNWPCGSRPAGRTDSARIWAAALTAAALGGVLYLCAQEICRNRIDDPVDQASEDSFPSSDPPAWTGAHA